MAEKRACLIIGAGDDTGAAEYQGHAHSGTGFQFRRLNAALRRIALQARISLNDFELYVIGWLHK